MISKLKKKFIILSMVSLLALLFIIVLGMNLISYNALTEEADAVLSMLSENHGNFPNLEEDFSDDRHPKPPMPDHITLETPHESRFFSVMYAKDGTLVEVNTSKIASVTSSDAVILAEAALDGAKDTGFIEEFRYIKTLDNGKIRLIFLDCSKKISSFKTFLTASIAMSLAGLLIIFIIISYFAERIIKPITESYNKQKQFITDAGHEMRTPLTIINANADLLAMEIGENESLEDIKNQSLRLSKLTNDLVKLSKMEEDNYLFKKIDFPLSDVVAETSLSFKQLALVDNKNISLNIQDAISYKGNPQQIEQLISILMENAIKYSPSDSQIDILLKKDTKNIIISITNETKDILNDEELNNIFERFYRIDKSRNSMTGGYGIGLSIARAIVNSHGGKISAMLRSNKSFTITTVLPI